MKRAAEFASDASQEVMRFCTRAQVANIIIRNILKCWKVDPLSKNNLSEKFYGRLLFRESNLSKVLVETREKKKGIHVYPELDDLLIMAKDVAASSKFTEQVWKCCKSMEKQQKNQICGGGYQEQQLHRSHAALSSTGSHNCNRRLNLIDTVPLQSPAVETPSLSKGHSETQAQADQDFR
ncbi:UNVERIFIED_CONTAM: hypothetical protein K2H54_053348 [Gekko kuhli]